jgi:hypothetical protein
LKIERPPYYANIVPHKAREDYLWFCVIRRLGSVDVLSRHDATSKEDAFCAALLDLIRLAEDGPPTGAPGSDGAQHSG